MVLVMMIDLFSTSETRETSADLETVHQTPDCVVQTEVSHVKSLQMVGLK